MDRSSSSAEGPPERVRDALSSCRVRVTACCSQAALGEEGGLLGGGEEAEEEPFHLAEVGVVGEGGETLAQRKERVPRGLQVRIHWGVKRRQPSEK